MKKLFIIAFLGVFVFLGCADKKKRSHFMPSFFAILSEDYDPNTKIVSVTTSVGSGTYSIGSTITIQVNFNNPVEVEDPSNICIILNNGEKVCGASGSGTSTLTFTYTITENSPPIQGLQVVEIEGDISAPSSGLLVRPQVPELTSPDALLASSVVNIDTTRPTVTNVTSTSSSGTYAVGSVISIAVTFSENVNVTGIPQLFLNVGTGVYASYVSGSGSNTLIFQYTVQSGDTTNGNDLNYTNIDALVLPNGASIADAAGNTPPGGTTTAYNGGATLSYVTLPPVDSNISLAGTSDVKIDSNATSVSFGAGGSGSGNEPTSGSTNFTIPITLSSPATQNLTLTYIISSSSTASSNDYSGLTGTLTIPQGSSSASISFSVLADGVYEGTETIVLEITGIIGGAIGSQNTFTFTINDAQTKPTLSFTAGANNTVTENVSGGNYSASLSLSGPTQAPVTFVVTTTGGTATAGSDYTAINNQTYTIPAGQTSFSFNVGILDDTIYDPNETFQIQLSSLSANANFQGGGSTLTQTVTISDDDTPSIPTLSFTSGANANVNENAGTYALSFTLSTTYISDVTFTVTTSNGTATAGSDYTAVNQTVTIPAGQTTATVNIPIANDTLVEGTETFTVTISGVNNANVSGATQTVSILDDDLGIVSATTMDTDADGKIDTYKIVFTNPVSDSTFDPSKWTISGYTGIAINTASNVGGESNTANDNTIYISFNEKTTPDTGAKPDVTVSAGGINGTGGQVLVAHNTASITEIDGAKPVLLSAEGTAGSTTLTLTFSEPVYGGTVASCTGTSGNVQTSHLVYNNVSSGGATAIGAVTDSCAEPDNVIVVTTTGTLAVADSGQDSVGGTSSLTDAAGNTLANTKTLSISSGIQPYIKTVELYDLDGDGNVDTLRAYFRDSTNSTNVDMNDSTLTNLSQFSVNGSAPSSVNTGTTANDHIVNFSVNNVLGTGPNVVSSFSYTRVGTDSWLSTGSSQLASFSSGYTLVDKAPPVIKSVTATDGANDKMTIVFSEDIPAAIRTAITSGTLGNYFILKNGNDQTISFPSIASVTWTASNTLEITFNGDVSSIITDGSSVTLSNSNQVQDAAGNFAVSTATMVGTFTTDLTPPYLALVTDVTPASNYSGNTGTSTILVEFSEGMKNDGGTNAANRIANYTLVPSLGGSPITISSITVVSPDVYQLNLSTRLTSGTEYKLTVGTSTQDLSGNSITNPRELTFVANDILRVLSAEALTSTSVKVTFSRLISSSSASCTGISACAAKYFFNPSLGNITSVTAGANSVTITLDGSVTMKGMSYTVVVANGINDDPASAPSAFDTGTGDAIRDSTGTLTLAQNPLDRITFQGKGASVKTFASGWYMDDPFADGSKFSFTFTFAGKVFVGPNEFNNATLRFDADGQNVVTNTFKFQSNSWKSVSLNCPNTSGLGYGFDGSNNSSCDRDGSGPRYSGPLYEEGLVGFTSLNLTGGSMLMIGPMINNASNAYFTQDTDNLLNTSIFALRSFTGGGNTKSIQAYFADANNLYMGHASNHGTQAPIMVRMPVTFSSGVVTNIADANNNSDNLNLDAAPVGKAYSGVTHVNSADAIGIDSFLAVTFSGQAKRIYIGNSVGVASSTNLDTFASAVISEPTGIRTSGNTNLVLPGIKAGGSFPEGLLKVSPGQRGVPFLRFHNGKLYMARNVALNSSHTNGAITEGNKTQNYAEVYVCATPTAGTSGNKYCNGSDWQRIITTNSSISDSTRLDTSKNDNKAISMFEITPTGVVYLGFDSPSGFRIYRAVAASADLPQGSGWTQQGTDGMGTCPTCYTHIQSSTVVQHDSTTYFTYITVGKFDTTSLWSVPIKVYRQGDVGTNVIVGSLENLTKPSTMMAAISHTARGSKMWVLAVLFVGIVLLLFRKKYIHI